MLEALSSRKSKRPLEDERSARRGTDALGDDDAVLRHEPIVPRVAVRWPDVSESGPQPPGCPVAGAQCTPASDTRPSTNAATSTAASASPQVSVDRLSGTTRRASGRRTREPPGPR